jgi:hypothetical protein
MAGAPPLKACAEACERVAEHFVGGEVVVRGCEFIADQITEMVKKAILGS